MAVVKDVYRDLLSANDDMFRQPSRGDGEGRDDRERRPPTPQGYEVYSLQDDIARKMPTYKGMLSIGLYEPMNRLIVSAPKFLMSDVRTLIQELDDDAGSQRVSVVRLNASMSEEEIHQVLTNLVGAPGASTAPRVSASRTGWPTYERSEPDRRRPSSLDIRRRDR